MTFLKNYFLIPLALVFFGPVTLFFVIRHLYRTKRPLSPVWLHITSTALIYYVVLFALRFSVAFMSQRPPV